MRRAQRIFSLLVFTSSFLAGCALTLSPFESVEEKLHYTEETAGAYQIISDWWTSYEDPQLNVLVAKALDQNSNYAKAAIAVNQALYRANLLGADLFPVFSAQASVFQDKNLKSGSPSESGYAGELSVSYELDLWRRLSDTALAKEWEYKATVEDRHSAKLALVNSVIDSYYKLAYQYAAIEIIKQYIANYEKLLETVKQKYKVGKVSRIEPEQVAQSLLTAQNNLILLEMEYKIAQHTLYNILNISPENNLDLILPDILAVNSITTDLDVPVAVLANRPDLRAAEYRLRGALKDVQASQKEWYPTITLGSILSSGYDSSRAMFNHHSFFGVVILNLPFLQWNTIRWKVKISQSEYEKLHIEFAEKITTALNEIDLAWFNYSKYKAMRSNLKQRYEHDITISNFYQKRYLSGASELSDWLESLNTMLDSRLEFLQCQYQVIRHNILIYKVLAGKYEKSKTLSYPIEK